MENSEIRKLLEEVAKGTIRVVYQCCVCRKMLTADGRYLRIVLNCIPETVESHGYCLGCTDNLIRATRERNEAREQWVGV